MVDHPKSVTHGVFDVGVCDAAVAGGVRYFHWCRLPCLLVEWW